MKTHIFHLFETRMEVLVMTDASDHNDIGNLARSLANLGVPIAPILENAGIRTIPIEAFAELEHFGENQLRSIKILLAIVDRLTNLHKELLQHAPNDVRERHQHLIQALLTSYDDSLDVSPDSV